MWQMALMAAPAILQLGTSIFGFLKGRKVKKQISSQMETVQAEQKMQMAQMMGKLQGQNVGAVNGMNQNYMIPSGMGGGVNYGPSQAGYYPGSMA